MKIAIEILIVGCTLVLFACGQSKHSSRIVQIQIHKFETNYHDNDSIQKLVGYPPVRVSMSMTFINLSSDTLYIPIKKRSDTTTKSIIAVLYYDIMFGQVFSRTGSDPLILLPNDTVVIGAYVLYNEHSIRESTYDVLRKIPFESSFLFSLNKSDTLLSKFKMPDFIAFDIDKNSKMQFVPDNCLDIE